MTAHRKYLLTPDCANRSPFRGLPHDFPSGHSRFPLEPSKGYCGLSFDPDFDQNAALDDRAMTDEERLAWRVAMQRALGNLVPIRIGEG